MLRVVLKLHHVVVPVRAAHQVRLRAPAHPPYLLHCPQHTPVILTALTFPGKALPHQPGPPSIFSRSCPFRPLVSLPPESVRALPSAKKKGPPMRSRGLPENS